jgi:hypothetical protein
MKNSFIVALLISAVTAPLGAFALEYDYSCESKTNRKVFETGESAQISIELNSGYLSIDNGSGIWNYLVQHTRPGTYVYFRSLSKDSQLQTDDLIAGVERSLFVGGSRGELLIYKGIQRTLFTQVYNCTLTNVRK